MGFYHSCGCSCSIFNNVGEMFCIKSNVSSEGGWGGGCEGDFNEHCMLGFHLGISVISSGLHKFVE